MSTGSPRSVFSALYTVKASGEVVSQRLHHSNATYENTAIHAITTVSVVVDYTHGIVVLPVACVDNISYMHAL